MLKLGKGWRKWLMIGFLVILGGLAILAFTTGCSGDKPATTTTPLQGLQTDVAAVKASLDTLDDSVFQNSNSLSVLETWKTGIETWKASVNEQIVNLQAGEASPDFTSNITSIQARLTFLELQWEGMVNPTPTPTVTPSGSPTATPTPTLVVYCGIHLPEAINPEPYDTEISATIVDLEWSGSTNVVIYELWIGHDLNNMDKYQSYNIDASTRADSYMEQYAVEPSKTYFWRIISKDACGNIASNTWWFRTLPLPTPTPTPTPTP